MANSALAPAWTKETAPRCGNPGGFTKAERRFRRALQKEQIPRANGLLTAVYDQAIAGDMKAAELFFKVCGLIRKPTNDADIQELAQKLLDGMIEEARQRRAASGGTGP